ncbi:unnamed protein product [Tuber melanosporum]|uniref:(Perigord truffle) hypothetical protein n=1 Tax=Tuber melanosporum (strain Mel28) TaxID=656061 RepID=D5GE60_TUBMM|nr:uncharacterized protein GSTUM_00006394001 [Tuber melanosporum]CAZ82803.1 unnamed protein product [Tuber melanosporum]
MTENPTIPSTPGPSQPPSLANSSTTPEDVADTSGEIDCICEISDDDGFTICCDKCDTWQHLVCVQLNGGNLPKTYYCPRCDPCSLAVLDVQKAKDIQRQRREVEQAKRSHKKKRPTGTSHKKKELANGTNGITSGKVSSSSEKTGVQVSGKSVGGKEMQQPSRKRGHRASAQSSNNAGLSPPITHHAVCNVPNANIPLESPSARNGETESDTDPEKPTRYLGEGFTDLGNSMNKYTGTDVQQLTHKMGDCACLGEKECLVKGVADGETVISKALNGNGNSRKQRRTNASTESTVGSKRPTPDRQSVPLKKEEDEESRSVSPPLSRSKPRSRDLTPSMPQDVAVEKGEMTGREARKFKEVLSRIQKQQQEEQQPQVAKRRKRNSTVSLTPGTSSLHSPGIDMKGWIKVPDSRSGPNHGFVEYSVTDAGVGRRASDSPVSSDERILRRTSSYSPVAQLTQGPNTLKHVSKTVLRPARPQYEDRAIQTDPVEEGIPWWSPAAVKAPPRPPRLPLRKLLMQSLLRDREEAAATVLEDKKRKHDAVSEDPENIPSPKVPKLSNSGSARSTTISPSLRAKGSLHEPLRTATLPTLDIGSLSNQALITPDMPTTMVGASAAKSPSSPRPPGPALADLFSADSDKPSSTQSSPTQEKQPSDKIRVNLPLDKPRVNGYRNSSLHVQLPPGSGAVNGPLTPALQSSLPSAPNSATIQPPSTTFPSYVSPSVSALNSNMVNPSPTRTTKKMSLEDYGKRKHKTEPVEKSDEKLSVKTTNEGPATSTNLSKPSIVSLVEEPTSIADPAPSTLSIVTALPPQAINSSKLAMEPIRIPPAPKDQRTTSLGSSVR